jgi:hypothetical protein
VDLPATVVTGQEFNVVVRRISTRQVPEIDIRQPEPQPQPRAGKRARKEDPQEAAAPAPRSWRYVVGTFQVKIPVSRAEVMLAPEENTLAIMKWRLTQMAPSSRWYPVLERYIRYIAARVDGLGGDSTSIQPSPTGVPPRASVPGAEREYTGKVCEVLFDCYGDFEGFVLDDCGRSHVFHSREHGVGEIALRACKERLRLSVYTGVGGEDRIHRLVIRC